MRIFILLIIILLPCAASGQAIANCIEIIDSDSIKFYFKSHGILVDKECADYYRVVKMNSDAYVFNGLSADHYITGETAVECNYVNNVLNGQYSSYYQNGQTKEQGEFRNGQKTGEWKSWFDNGQLKKVIVFSAGDYYLREFYKRNGKQLVLNGDGKFNDDELISMTIVKGEIKNGKQHGKWTLYNRVSNSNTAIENFNNGKFIEGQNIAIVQSFNKKYYDNPESVVDLTTDLLNLSYTDKIGCINYGKSNAYRRKRYNSQNSALPFFDYIYMNFDPSKIISGYILVGFAVNKNGEINQISSYSTIKDKLVEDELIRIFSSSEKWEAETLNNNPIEITELFVFQFFDGNYKILNDSRNKFPLPMKTLEHGAKFKFGNDSLASYVISTLNLPMNYQAENFNLAACFEFQIDEKGNLIEEAGIFINRLRISDSERHLYNALSNALKGTGIWQPATVYDTPTRQYFNAVLNIKNGKPKLRLFSRNWVLE